MTKQFIKQLAVVAIAAILSLSLGGCFLMGKDQASSGSNSNASSGSNWGGNRVTPDDDEPSTDRGTGDSSSTTPDRGTDSGTTPDNGGGGSTGIDYAGVYILHRARVADTSIGGSEMREVFPPDKNYIEIIDRTTIIFVLDGERMETIYYRTGDELRVLDGGTMLDFTIEGDEISFYLEDLDTTLYFLRTDGTDQKADDGIKA